MLRYIRLYNKIYAVIFSFYIILNGSVSVYIDPRMTGEEEGGHWTPLRQHKTPSPAPSSFSGTPEPGQPDQPRVKSAHALEPLAEEEEDEDNDEVKEKGTMRKPAPKKLAVLDRSKFGKFIVSYGKRKLKMYLFFLSIFSHMFM